MKDRAHHCKPWILGALMLGLITSLPIIEPIHRRPLIFADHVLFVLTNVQIAGFALAYMWGHIEGIVVPVVAACTTRQLQNRRVSDESRSSDTFRIPVLFTYE